MITSLSRRSLARSLLGIVLLITISYSVSDAKRVSLSQCNVHKLRCRFLLVSSDRNFQGKRVDVFKQKGGDIVQLRPGAG